MIKRILKNDSNFMRTFAASLEQLVEFALLALRDTLPAEDSLSKKVNFLFHKILILLENFLISFYVYVFIILNFKKKKKNST